MSSGGIAVVGAGIVGLAIARRLAQSLPGTAVTVLDKEDRVGAHQTGHNSGVVHAGLYYKPGSLKATLCRRGVGMLREYCAEKSIAFDECGKVVIAATADETSTLDAIIERATANQVPGLRRLDAAGLREVEPHAAGVAAILSPHTAITDYSAITRAMADDVAAAGGEVLTRFDVTAMSTHGSGGVVLTARDGRRRSVSHVVVCGGLQSDRLARMAGDSAGPAIVPFRGEYYRLIPPRSHLVRGLVYPVPDPAYPFLGVHFTKRVDGGVDVGPNAVLALAREGYRRTQVNPGDLASILAWPGFRRLALQHWRTGLSEMAGSASRRVFMDRARRYVPDVRDTDVVAAPAGIRAQAVDADGSLVDDFRISSIGGVTVVRNAPSPAATSSLAIAEHVCGTVLGLVASGG